MSWWNRMLGLLPLTNKKDQFHIARQLGLARPQSKCAVKNTGSCCFRMHQHDVCKTDWYRGKVDAQHQTDWYRGQVNAHHTSAELKLVTHLESHARKAQWVCSRAENSTMLKQSAAAALYRSSSSDRPWSCHLVCPRRKTVPPWVKQILLLLIINNSYKALFFNQS